MATNTKISNAAAIAGCDAVVDRFENGTGTAKVEIRDGSQPASVDAVAAGSVLASIDLNSPAFGNAADAAPGGQASADTSPALQDTSADASGTATWFRGYEQGGNGLIDGECGTSASDMNLDNTSINAGQTVSIESWSITMPES